MATAAYYAWVRAGRPWRPALWIGQIRTLCTAHGIAWLGTLGSDDPSHLQAANPLDHTPFPSTPWPVRLPGYIVCACDHKNAKGLGAKLVADARAGRPEVLAWLKYANYGGNRYDARLNWQPVDNDDEHLHLSGRSDAVDYRIPNSYIAELDAYLAGGATPGGDMDPNGRDVHKDITNAQALRDMWDRSVSDRNRFGVGGDIQLLEKVNTKLDQLLAAQAAGGMSDAQVEALAARLRAELVDDPDTPLGEADEPAIERAVRRVLRAGVDADG